MIKSPGVDLGLATPSLGLGEGTNLRLLKSHESSRLGACRHGCTVRRRARGRGDAGQFSTGRRHARRAQAADEVQLDCLRAELPGLGQRGRHRHIRLAKGFRRIRTWPEPRRRHGRAGFQRRLGQRFHRARPALPRSRPAHHCGHQRGDACRRRRSRQRCAGSLLRVDVRVPAAVGQDPLCAATGASARPSDLDGRPRRRCQGRQLLRPGPDDRGTRRRAAGEIHFRHGWFRRSARALPERAALGRTARIVAGRTATDQSGDDRPDRRRTAARRRCRRAGGGSHAQERAGSVRERSGRCRHPAGEVDQDRRSAGTGGIATPAK